MRTAIFDIILILALIMGIYACWPEPTDAKYATVDMQLYSVKAIQTELVRRGHDIVVDGKFGPQTDLALTIELTGGKQ